MPIFKIFQTDLSFLKKKKKQLNTHTYLSIEEVSISIIYLEPFGSEDL